MSPASGSSGRSTLKPRSAVAWMGFSSSSKAVSRTVSEVRRTGAMRAGPQTNSVRGSRPGGTVAQRRATRRPSSDVPTGCISISIAAIRGEIPSFSVIGPPRSSPSVASSSSVSEYSSGGGHAALSTPPAGAPAVPWAGASARNTRVTSVGLYWNVTSVGSAPLRGFGYETSAPLINATAGRLPAPARALRGPPRGRPRPRPLRGTAARRSAPRSRRAGAPAAARRGPRRAGEAAGARDRSWARSQQRPGPGAAELVVLAPQGVVDVAGADDATVRRGQVGRRERRGLDAAARQLGGGERLPVQVADGRTGRERAAPELGSERGVGQLETDHEAQPPDERLVECPLPVGREDHQAGERLDSLEQVVDLQV